MTAIAGASDHGGGGCGALVALLADKFLPMNEEEVITCAGSIPTARGGPGGLGYLLRFSFSEYTGLETLNYENAVLGDWLLIPGDVVREADTPLGTGGALLM